MRIIALVTFLLAAAPVLAQQKQWTPAPVPRVGAGAGDTVMPAARVGNGAGRIKDAPFSALPPASVAAGGATSSNKVNGVDTPNLSPR